MRYNLVKTTKCERKSVLQTKLRHGDRIYIQTTLLDRVPFENITTRFVLITHKSGSTVPYWLAANGDFYNFTGLLQLSLPVSA